MAGAIKASNGLPSDKRADWDYYTTFTSFRDVTQVQSENLENQVRILLFPSEYQMPDVPEEWTFLVSGLLQIYANLAILATR